MNDGKDLTYPAALAFPIATGTRLETGLTKREAFAMAAMQGLCAAPDSGQWKAGQIANYAIEQADALIAALNKPQETKA